MKKESWEAGEFSRTLYCRYPMYLKLMKAFDDKLVGTDSIVSVDGS